jgi:hypothetical protein
MSTSNCAGVLELGDQIVDEIKYVIVLDNDLMVSLHTEQSF